MQSLAYWHWLTLGVVLLLAEVAVGGASFLMWVGFAAIFTGVLAFLLPAVMGWQAQLVVMSVASVASVWLWKRYVKDAPVEGGVTLNRRGAEHVGRIVPLEEAIVGGEGRVRLDDTLWSVRGADAPAGARVRIVRQDGNAFEVESA